MRNRKYNFMVWVLLFVMVFSVPVYGQFKSGKPYTQRQAETVYDEVAAQQHIQQLQQALNQKGKKKEVAALYDLVIEDFDRLSTVLAMSQIAYDNNIWDEETAERATYWNTLYTEQYDKIYSCLYDGFSTEYADLLKKKIGTELPTEYEALSEKAFALKEKEQNLIQQYQQATAKSYTVQIDGAVWDDEKLQQADISDVQYAKINEALTKERNQALGAWYKALVQVRKEMAKEAGYDDYTEYATDMYGRDYTAKDAKQFCENVKTYIVPLYEAIWEEIEQKGDLSKELATFENNPTQDIMDTVAIAVQNISPELSNIYTYMCRYGLYDFQEHSAQRVGGAYTVGMPYYKDAYLFANKENTYVDYQTILHEFGHFASYCYDETPDLFRGFSVDVAEIQSQALELLALHEAETMFGNKAEAYTLAELSDILFSIISSAMIYEFEDAVYQNADMTVTEMNRLFADIQTEYHAMFFDEYGAYCYDWVEVGHLFESPMYYIGYGTSAFSALNIWVMSQQDYEAAVDTYLNIVQYASNSSYMNVVEVFDLENVFDERDVKNMAKMIANTEEFGGDGVIQMSQGLDLSNLWRTVWKVWASPRFSMDI